jgi:hypothetical protein
MWKLGCGEKEKNQEVLMVVYNCGWWYMINKFVELLDTVKTYKT